MSEYLPEPRTLGVQLKVELDLFNYATKTRFKKCNGN